MGLGNRNSFVTGQKDITAAGTAEQLDNVAIPDGFKVILCAKPGNAGYIYLGNSKENAENSSTRFDRLEAGDSIPLQITNLNLVWVTSSEDGDGISYYVEA